ncbi:MAG: hypothetical protein Cons2KO_30220 [Congregibacter sp.]
MLKKTLGIPYICFIHGEDVQTAAESRELTWIVRKVLRGARKLIANSHNTEALLQNKWQAPDSKIVVLHPGMDANRFVPATPDEELLARMGWVDKKIILTVGRLQRRKGQDMLIRALPEVLRYHPNAMYVIIGEGEEQSSLESLVAQLDLKDRVEFHSAVDDETMIRCYQHCTVFALPNRDDGSDIEGFGMVLAEAQACGKPVLAGDSGGTRETMRVGESGIIIDCTEPTSLARSLVDLLNNPDRLEEMGAQGRKHVETNLDWDVHVRTASTVFAEKPC